MGVEIKYTNASGKSQTITASSPSAALKSLSALPGYINREADALTNALGGSLKERRKQRAADFASGRGADAMNPGSSRQGAGVSDIIQGFGGLIVEDGAVVGAKSYDIKIQDGKVVGTSGMREVRNVQKSEKKKESDGEGVKITASGRVVIRTVYDSGTHELYNIVGNLSVVNGEIVITGEEKQLITTAVAETVAQ